MMGIPVRFFAATTREWVNNAQINDFSVVFRPTTGRLRRRDSLRGHLALAIGAHFSNPILTGAQLGGCRDGAQVVFGQMTQLQLNSANFAHRQTSDWEFDYHSVNRKSFSSHDFQRVIDGALSLNH